MEFSISTKCVYLFVSIYKNKYQQKIEIIHLSKQSDIYNTSDYFYYHQIFVDIVFYIQEQF